VAIHRRAINRTEENKQALQFLIVVCGASTEVTYFEKIKVLMHSSKIRIEVVPPKDNSMSDPQNVVEKAKARMQEIGFDIEIGDQCWCVIDIDHNLKDGHKKNLLAAKKMAKEKSIEIVFSNPCFEVWLHMHLHDCTPFVGLTAKSYIDELKKKNPGYRKDNMNISVDSWKKARDLAKSTAVSATPWPDNPGSDVFKLMDSLEKFIS
jgi:RloB-like protein